MDWDWDWETFAVCVAIAALVLLPPSLDPAIRFKQWMENKERRRRTTERLNENAYLTKEDGYQYPRCDIPKRDEDPYDEL